MQIIARDERGLETFFISIKLFLSLEQVSPIIVFKYPFILKNLNLKKKEEKKTIASVTKFIKFPLSFVA